MKYLILIIQICVVHGVAAQNVIYFTDETKMVGKITEILPNKIKFIDDETDKSEVRQNEKVCFAFNSKGSYLTFSRDMPPTLKEKEDFIKQVGDPSDFDIIAYTSGVVIFTHITKETEDQLSYINDKIVKETVPTSTVSFLIRRDGTHKVFISNQQATSILKLNQQRVNNFIQNVKTVTPSGNPSVEKVTTLSREQKSLFSTMAYNKVQDFTTYIKQVSSTTIPSNEKDKDINLASDLFKQGAKIQVTNVNVDTKQIFALRDYLYRVKFNAGRYQKIEIESADVSYVTSFRADGEGNIYGSVTYTQKFIGYVDNKPAYQDVTTKKVEIIIKTYNKSVNGQDIRAYDVFLGDVSVMQTRKKV